MVAQWEACLVVVRPAWVGSPVSPCKTRTGQGSRPAPPWPGGPGSDRWTYHPARGSHGMAQTARKKVHVYVKPRFLIIFIKKLFISYTCIFSFTCIF